MSRTTRKSMPPIQTIQQHNLLNAQLVQQALLPKKRHFDRLFSNSFVFYQPKEVLSGDFYWVGRKNNLRYLVVGDCAGHGVSASLTTVLALSLFEYIIMNKGVKRTDKILSELNTRYTESFKSNTEQLPIPWIEVSILCIDDEKQCAYYSSANRKMLYIDSNNEQHIIKAQGFAIGEKSPRIKKFTTTSFDFKKGELIYLGSDGYQHQFGGPKNKKFGAKHVHHLLQTNAKQPFEEQCEALDFIFQAWKGDEDQTDDICIVGVEI